MSTKQVKITYVIAAVLIAFIMLIPLMAGGGAQYASAAASSYSDVLGELRHAGNFNADDYPSKSDDYSIQVIQIAESASGYIYVYTYQPCQQSRKFPATNINMSLTENATETELYELIFVNTNGVFAKYLVKDIKASNAYSRCYNVTSIYRAWDNDIDGETGNNNTDEGKAYPVGRIFRVRTENGTLICSSDPVYVVQIINPYSDFLIYITNAGLPNISSIKLAGNRYEYFDGHYIAFSTDWDITVLKSATVSYAYRAGTGYFQTFLGFDCGGDVEYGGVQRATAEPTYEDKALIEGTGALGERYRYEWDRIQTVEQFIATEKNLTEETKNNLAGKQWVLRFLETKRTQTELSVVGYKKYSSNFTKVDKVTILRLEFDVGDKPYDLGAVSDMMSGDIFPGNAEQVESQTFWQWLADLLGVDLRIAKIIFWCVVGLILLAIAIPVLSAIFPAFGHIVGVVLNAVGKAFVWLLKGLWWLICLPFKGLTAIFKIIKQRTSERKKRKEEERQVKLEQEQQMRLYKHRADLERKENKCQQKLDDKDAKKTQKAKDKQSAKRNKKAAKKRRQAAKKRAKNKKKGKGKTK